MSTSLYVSAYALNTRYQYLTHSYNTIGRTSLHCHLLKLRTHVVLSVVVNLSVEVSDNQFDVVAGNAIQFVL